MILIDFIFLLVIFFSTFLGMFRGFLKELISTSFWLFFIYFFLNYTYFSAFYSDIFFKNENYLVILITIIFFFITKILLNFIVHKIIKKLKLLYINIILGGLFGLFRGLILLFLLLLIISKYNNIVYLNLLNQSFFIHLFFNSLK